MIVLKIGHERLFEAGQLCAVLATRDLQVNGAKIIRIVDVIGELKGNIKQQMREMLYEEQAEYIDLLNYD